MVKNPWLLFIAIASGSFIFGIDFLAIAVAVEPMAKSLAINIDTVQWFLTAFAIGEASFLVASGRLADRYGHRPVFISGVLIFIVSSLVIAVSYSPALIIFARFLQGVSGGIMATGAVAILVSVYQPAERAGWIAGLVGAGGLGMVLGPAVGGFLIQHFSWRMVFLINLPIGLISIFFTLLYVPKQPPLNPGQKLDLLGMFFLTITLGLFTVGISQGQFWGWAATKTLMMFGLTIIMVGIFIYVEHRCQQPLIEFALFKIKNFLAATSIAFIMYFVLIAWILLFGIYLQRVAGLSPQMAGISLLPFGVVMVIFSSQVGKLAKRFSAKTLIIIGFLLGVVAFIGMATIAIHPAYSLLILWFALFGACFVLVNSCSMQAALEFMPAAKAGIGSAKAMMMRWLGGAIGAAVMSTVFTVVSSTQIQDHRMSMMQADHYGLVVSMLVLAILSFIALLISQIWIQQKTL